MVTNTEERGAAATPLRKWMARVALLSLFGALGLLLEVPGFSCGTVLGTIGACAVVLGLIFKPWRGN